MALTTETTDNRPEAVAFAFGRVWYAGVQGQRWSSTLFYSQVLTDVNRAGKCYQDADPTAEEINSLIDSDGGTMRIPELGRVLAMVPLSNTLVIVADNGVWSVAGGSEGFSPISFFISRITKIGCVSRRSVVEVEDTVFYAADDGVYQIGAAQESRKVVATNITEPKVDSFYNDVTHSDLVNSVSVYDNKEKVYSLHYGPVNALDKTLNLRLKSGSWYPYTFDTDSDTLSATFRIAYPFYSQESRTNTGAKFLVYSDDGVAPVYSINEYNDAAFVDFGNAPIEAYLDLAPLTLDNPQFDKSAPYVTSYFQFTETSITGVDVDGKAIYTYPSSALLTPKWEWHSTVGGQKIGRQRQVYRFREPLAAADGSFDIGLTVVTSRDKIRGHGKALGLKYETEAGKDMRLIGLTLPITMDGQY